jgi:hypothetical protein
MMFKNIYILNKVAKSSSVSWPPFLLKKRGSSSCRQKESKIVGGAEVYFLLKVLTTTGLRPRHLLLDFFFGL